MVGQARIELGTGLNGAKAALGEDVCLVAVNDSGMDRGPNPQTGAIGHAIIGLDRRGHGQTEPVHEVDAAGAGIGVLVDHSGREEGVAVQQYVKLSEWLRLASAPIRGNHCRCKEGEK